MAPGQEALSSIRAFNQSLLRELRTQGFDAERIALETALHQPGSGRSNYIVDSLYLEAFPDLSLRLKHSESLSLFLHYLPTLVRLGRSCDFNELTTIEKDALRSAERVLVPSAYMKQLLRTWAPLSGSVHIVEPGVPSPNTEAQENRTISQTPSSRQAAVVGTLREEKGQLALLQQLALIPVQNASWGLKFLGDATSRPAYNDACEELVRRSEVLQGRISFTGELGAEEVQQSLRNSTLLVSASRMESYGMALAEARAIGIPILALDRGNASAHVKKDCGGELCRDDAQLATRLHELCSQPAELSRRKKLAQANVRNRSWAQAADDLLTIS